MSIEDGDKDDDEAVIVDRYLASKECDFFGGQRRSGGGGVDLGTTSGGLLDDVVGG